LLVNLFRERAAGEKQKSYFKKGRKSGSVRITFYTGGVTKYLITVMVTVLELMLLKIAKKEELY